MNGVEPDRVNHIEPNQVYTTGETRDFLRVSDRTIKRLLKKGILRANKVGGQYRIMGHEILRLVSPEVDHKATTLYQRVKQSTREKVKDW